MTSSEHVYEIRPRKDRRGFDLIGDRLPLGVLWFEGAEAVRDAVNYARLFSRSHPAVVRVLDAAGAVADTLELATDCFRVVNTNRLGQDCGTHGGSGRSFSSLPSLCLPMPAICSAVTRSPVVALSRKRGPSKRAPSLKHRSRAYKHKHKMSKRTMAKGKAYRSSN